ncbi:hypothetical protein GF412_04995 [Candidatus Micrarchaeota archaeon]|nr:hypothetical protein [Candidatus Micrarchaeota archaeon]MBD3418310.1 hypothetical protein [Candidatus Micrarchaeota archaeon]
MQSPGKSIIKPRQPRKRAPMKPTRIISAKEKDDIERFSFAQKDPGEFALQNKGLIYLGIRRHNLDLVRGVQMEDVEQECLVSLIKSARKWLPPKGKFSSFAVESMKDCKRVLEKTHSLLHFTQESRNDIFAYRTWKRYHPQGRTDDFAAYMAISLSKARQIEWTSEIYKNARVPKDGSTLLYGEKAGPKTGAEPDSAPYIPISRVRKKQEHYPNPVSSVEKASLKKAISSALFSLNDFERSALEASFGLNGTPQKSVSEIAGDLKLSREKARSLVALAARKLKTKLERQGLNRELIDQE